MGFHRIKFNVYTFAQIVLNTDVLKREFRCSRIYITNMYTLLVLFIIFFFDIVLRRIEEIIQKKKVHDEKERLKLISIFNEYKGYWGYCGIIIFSFFSLIGVNFFFINFSEGSEK